MNDDNFGAASIDSTSMPYKDRSAGLVIFGILTILMGCLAALMVPLMMLGQAASAKAGNAPMPTSALVPAESIYGVLAVALVWLGIGSTMARRWARALLLIFSWSWLIVGLLGTIFMAFLMPHTLANMPSGGANGHHLPPGAIQAVMVVMFVVFGVIFVILPSLWTFFYASRHVKATCEARDPVTRWTDACPLSVLAVCLWLVFSVPMMLLMPIVGYGVMPFFGFFLTGMPATILCLVLAVIWGYAARLLYKLDPLGWWLILIAMCLLSVSSFLTFSRHDMTEMYGLMHYSSAQLDQIQKTGLLTGNHMLWIMAVSMLPFLGYLLFIKRYFRAQA